MAQNVYVVGVDLSKEASEYVNGQIVKVHSGGTYDARLGNGQVVTYIESVSTIVYYVGDYVSILIAGVAGSRSWRIIGSGRKMTDPSGIPVVRIDDVDMGRT